MIDKLPYEHIFVGKSLTQIIEMKSAGAANNSTGEFAVPIAELGESKLEELKAFVASNSMHMQVPDDVQVFFTVGPLTQLLSGVRKQVLSLLGEARVKSKSNLSASSAALH